MERCKLESREKEKNRERERKKGMPVGFKCNLKDLTIKSTNSASSQWTVWMYMHSSPQQWSSEVYMFQAEHMRRVSANVVCQECSSVTSLCLPFPIFPFLIFHVYSTYSWLTLEIRSVKDALNSLLKYLIHSLSAACASSKVTGYSSCLMSQILNTPSCPPAANRWGWVGCLSKHSNDTRSPELHIK